MRLIKRWMAGGAVVLALGALTPGGPPRAAETLESFASTAAGDNTCYRFTSKEKSFTTKMNSERSRKGKGTMKLDPELSRAAKKHTHEMINKNLLHHTPSSTLARRVTSWSTLGENVGVGSTVDSLHEAFMNSPAHRDNILHSSFRFVGVGSKNADGRLWVTVIFEASSNPGTTLSMPRC